MCFTYNWSNKKMADGLNRNADSFFESRWLLWKRRNTAVTPVHKAVLRHKNNCIRHYTDAEHAFELDSKANYQL